MTRPHTVRAFSKEPRASSCGRPSPRSLPARGSTSRHRFPVAGEADVLVVGGGVAGVAAAVAAAREGQTVALLEKTCALGGLATLGNVVQYLPLCDGRGHQVIGGLAEAFLRLSVADGYQPIPDPWAREASPEERARQRFAVRFNPVAFLLELERLVIHSRIVLRYDTRACGVEVEDERIWAVWVEDATGRRVWKARAVVDASGDAWVCAWAGAPTRRLASNVPCGWLQYALEGRIRLAKLTAAYDPEGRRRGPGPFFAGDRAEDVTRQILASRDLIRAHLVRLRTEHAPARVDPVYLPLMPTFRMTRRLHGRLELAARHAQRSFWDTVGFFGDWRKAGPVYPLPFRALIPRRPRNLVVAGRCLSANRTLWDVTRAIPVCVQSGEIAGIAAALISRDRLVDFQRLDVDCLRASLRVHGAILAPPSP